MSLARQSDRQISDGIQEQFWLYWNVLRRSPAYRWAHARLIEGWNAELSRTDFDQDVHVQGRRWAVQRALQACKELECSQLSPDASRGDVEESMMVVQAAEASRYYSVPADRSEAITKWLGTCEKRDGLPELSKFAEDWGILFPIPPQYNPVPDDQICGQSVKPVTIVHRSWKSNPGGIEHTLVVHLKLNTASARCWRIWKAHLSVAFRDRLRKSNGSAASSHSFLEHHAPDPERLNSNSTEMRVAPKPQRCTRSGDVSRRASARNRPIGRIEPASPIGSTIKEYSAPSTCADKL
jgi:hypothetical protein